jgi:hypothetical protein
MATCPKMSIYTVSSHNRYVVLRAANKSHGAVPLKRQSQGKHFKRNFGASRCVWTRRDEQREVEMQDHQLLPGQRLLLELEYVLSGVISLSLSFLCVKNVEALPIS